MRHALRRAFGAALVLLALVAARFGHAAEPRPVVRVVLVAKGDPPPWFDGFVKHLERELGLRDIDVVTTRSEREPAAARSVGGAPSLAAVDAELVVDVPSALRPVLRFAVLARDQPASDGSSVGRVRQVNLAGVPADGCALALAVAADELMRSNWPRAVPSEAAHTAAADGKAAAAAAAAEGTTPAAPKATGDGQRPAAGQAQVETPIVAAQSASPGEVDANDAGEQGVLTQRAGNGLRSSIGLAAAGETFTGGQTQMGADLRWAVRLVPRLDLEVRGGWRRILRQQATHGAIDGSAFLGGGALRIAVIGSARANVGLVGRADLLRIAYRGEPRDGTVDGMSGNALAFVMAAGPWVRIALTRSLALEAEVLAGASPLATTATDAGNAVFSTNGTALMGGLALSFGL